ncbi:ogr/Delta-like zinc finger family protein [Lysobacter arvi]|uniref:Ogr/Delta-like zinc finger family protein n=1 Tax=Lysobacter arvi TaxID=3038776 RepID=A0ABU1CBD1_9GAMM|nr:ogr/Delta-like zinc finger family protein [Lysobacter arvi]MDR0182425.1 ogr/Delta-like zinc finger family protein [Lysobacter arvi]
MTRVVTMTCPACQTPGRIRSSAALSNVVRVQYFVCRMLGCGCQWKVLAESVSILTPSALPFAAEPLPKMDEDERIALFVSQKSAGQQADMFAPSPPR